MFFSIRCIKATLPHMFFLMSHIHTYTHTQSHIYHIGEKNQNNDGKNQAPKR